MPIDCISFRDTAYASKLICDYVEQHTKLQPLYNCYPTLESFKHQADAKKVEFSTEKRTVLVSALSQQYEKSGPSDLTTSIIQSLANQNTFTVTTGHQLNLLGGPLYFLYKIITTINLAKELKRNDPKNNFIPIFWMATEDHDFEEINHFNFQNKRFQWSQETSGAVGLLDTSGLSDLITVFSNVLGKTVQAKFLKELLNNTYTNHSNLADATRYLVHALFEGEDLLVIDGNDAALKRLFIPAMATELTTSNAFKFISQTSEILKLMDNDYKIQVNPRELNLFYLKDNVRERIVKIDEVYSVLNTQLSWDLQGILEELNLFPERFSPNVIMRPLFQETILPNLCYIGGGGELSYWLQLKTYFDSELLNFPILLHRNAVLLVSQKQQQKLDKLNLSVAELFKNKQELIDSQIKKMTVLTIDFSNQKTALKQQFLALYNMASQTDKSFLGAVSAQEKKQIKGLEVLEKRLLKAEKKSHKNYINRLEQLHSELFPNGNLQERFSNFSEFHLEHGDDFIERLKKELVPLDQNFHIFYL